MTQVSHVTRCAPSAVTRPSDPLAAWCCQLSVGPFTGAPSVGGASLYANVRLRNAMSCTNSPLSGLL
jgi:hypothetical protein